MFWTGYAFNAMAYDAKDGDQVQRNLGQGIGFTMLRLYFAAGKDIYTDNLFTSHYLDKLLLEQNLALIQVTVGKYRR